MTVSQKKQRVYEHNETYGTMEGRFNIKVWCNNCTHDSEIAVMKGTTVNTSHLKRLKCPVCETVGHLQKDYWHYTTEMRLRQK